MKSKKCHYFGYTRIESCLKKDLFQGPYLRALIYLYLPRHNNKLIRRIMINFMLEKSILPLSWFQFQQYFRGKFMATKRSVPFPVAWLIEYWVEAENSNSAESNIESNLRIWKTSNRISFRILKLQNVESNIESNLKIRKPSNRISNRILFAKKR